MRLLLDTHVYLWAVTDDPKLGDVSRRRIMNATDVYVSSASIWEISIKVGLGKLEANVDSLVWEIEASGFIELPVKAAHAARVRHLPDIHRDPFDRILIAQALCEPLYLLSADAQVAKYGDLIIPVS